MLRKKMYSAISYEANFQCSDILIFYFAYLLKLIKTRGKPVSLIKLCLNDCHKIRTLGACCYLCKNVNNARIMSNIIYL